MVHNWSFLPFLKMASFRRNMSVAERDGGVQNGEVGFGISSPSSSSKLSHSQIYLPPGRLLNSLANLLYFPGVLLQSSRPVERSKLKGLHWRRSFVHFFIFFMLGVLISFSTLLSVDVSSKRRSFSFEEDVVVENSIRKIGSVEKELLSVDKTQSVEDHNLKTISKWEVKIDALDAPPAISAFPDLEFVSRKLLIIVTPTFERPFQAYYLNRLAHTLKVVPPPLLWIVVEMSSQSTETSTILRDAGVMYRHLVCNQNVTSIRNREVHQRNVALSHIEKHQLDGIVHFAEDDRMYSVDLFDQMRQISRFGVWPVATLSESKKQVLLEGPVCNGSQVIGWHTNRRNKLSRRFPLDMSGFAFNSTILWDLKRWHRPTLEPIRQHDRAKEGYQETTLVEQLAEDESQMEGFPSDCSRVMVWHLHLESSQPFHPNGWLVQKNLEVVATLT